MTAAWLSEVLGAEVVSVSEERIGIFTTEISRLRVTHAGGDTETLVLKRAVPGRSDRLGERFANEIRFYRELARRVPARTPRLRAGGADPHTGRDFLLIEDLALAETSWLTGPSEEHARRAVAALARMHAAFFGRVDELDWIPSFADPELLAAFDEAYARNWPSRRDLFCDLVPAFGRVGDALLGRILETHARLAEEPTLLHGDAHAENLPRSGGEVVLLDWAGPRRGNAGVDVGFFVSMSFPAERRADVERSLVAHHADVLAACGARSRLDPWLAYRRGVLRRIARIVGIVDTWDASTLSALRMIVHRCATAAVELQVDELAGR